MKNCIYTIVAAIALSISFVQVSIAQTVHTIIACNTIDNSIGTGMTSDMKNMRNAIQIIVGSLDCEYEEIVFDGEHCTKENVIKCINDLEVESNDIVFFFYGGHGTHAFDNANDPWPQLCMNTNIESLFIPLAYVEKLIAAKQPKLRVIISNCCNKEQSGVSIKPMFSQSSGPTMMNDYNASAFRKLFLETEGKVMMTSSKLGQYSWCNEGGGFFTNDFIDVLDEVGKNRLNAEWETVCKATQSKTFSKVFQDNVKQEPYYELAINDRDGNNDNNRVDDKKDDNKKVDDNVPPSRTGDLFNALQVLVNHDLTKDQRLGKIAEIQRKYFYPDAHVITVGRNGTSMIMYEDVSDFLRRLALSNNIKQINVIEGDNMERNTIITVHEIR